MKSLFLNTRWPVMRFLLFLVVFLFLSVPSVTRAKDSYWIGGAGGFGFWNWAANWTHGIPETGDMAFIGNDETGVNWSKTVDYDITPTYASGDPYVPAGVNLTATGTNTVELYHYDGTLTIDGTYNSLVITAFDAGTAAYHLSDDGVLVEKGYEVKVATGHASTGSFEQSGGIFQLNAALYIGDGDYGSTFSNSHGGYYMTGGTMDGWTDNGGNTHYGSITLGEWGAYGEFLQDNGSVTIGALNLGRQVGSEGYYLLNNGSLTLLGNEGASGQVTIGLAGTGEFDQIGGVHTTECLTIGANHLMDWDPAAGEYTTSVGGTGSYTLETPVPGDGSSNLSVTRELILGEGGVGNFNHLEGRVTIGENLYLGKKVYEDSPLILCGTGNYYLDGGDNDSSILTVNGHEWVGFTGAGAFGQYGGTHSVMGNLYIGDRETVSGTYYLTGGLLDVSAVDPADEYAAGYTIIGHNGIGEFIQEGGEFLVRVLVLGGGPYAGANPAVSTGTFNMSDGSLTAERLEVGHDDGKGIFNHTGGSLTTNVLSMGNYSGGVGEYTISNDAVLQVNDDLKIGSSPEGKALFTQKDASSVTVTNTIWVGSGELPADLNGIYDMQGGTLTAGKIEVSPRGIFINTGGTINAEAVNWGILSGTGTYNGNVVNYGTIEPGSSPGTLIIDGNLAMDAENSILHIELGGAGPGEYDLLQVNGTAEVAGLLNVDFYGTYIPEDGTFFDILIADILLGDLVFGHTPLGWKWDLAYLDRTGDNNLDTIRLTANAVPIPGSIWLLAPALIGTAGWRRRQKNKKKAWMVSSDRLLTLGDQVLI